MYEYEREAQAEFLSHLSGDEARLTLCNGIFFFLSHLSGDEERVFAIVDFGEFSKSPER